MWKRELSLKFFSHCLVGQQIIALTRQQSRNGDLVILIGLDSELTPVMPVWNESFVKLLNREWEREIFRVPVADIAHQPMKNSI